MLTPIADVGLVRRRRGVAEHRLKLTVPVMFAALPFVSGLPTVSCDEVWAGGLQDGNSRLGPWTRFGEVQAVNAGTNDAFSGVAPFGRG